MQALEQNLEATLNQASIEFVDSAVNDDEAVHLVSVHSGTDTEILTHENPEDHQHSNTLPDDKPDTEPDNDSSQSH